MTDVVKTVGRYIRREDGAAGFGLLWLGLCIVFTGLAVDVSNGYRYKTLLGMTADAAAHTGVIVLAEGGDADEVRAAVLAEVEANMPAADHGTLLANAETDIQLLFYDVDTGGFSVSSDPNAVRVVLRRSRAEGNPLPTIFLQVADVFDRDAHDYSSWTVIDSSIATLAETEVCRSYNYLYAGGDIDLTSQNSFGARFCLHGQGEVWMSQQNSFAEGAGISMPNLDACKSKCDDNSNPGAGQAAFESNLLVEDMSAMIRRIEADFLNGTEERERFFLDRPLDSDLSPLNGVTDTSALSRGAVVELTRRQFELLVALPEGLTYHVTCNGNQPLKFSGLATGMAIRNIALISDCGLNFDGSVEIVSSLLLSTKQASNATITASSGARLGTELAECRADERSFLYALGEMQVPAGFAGSNVVIAVRDGIKMAAGGPSFAQPHVGLTLITEGDLHVSADHTFDSCATPPDGRTPRLRVIRHIEPVPQT